jgi:predicted AAA+ superfamily ATPase
MTDERSEARENIRRQYRPRVIDKLLREDLSAFGGVLITGPRSCGKSWTGSFHSESALFMGDEETNRYAELNPTSALKGDFPRLIDEWQDVPKLWDLARRNIDFGSRKGMYIFTGSSIHPLNKTRHTGIGRFSILEMRTMSLFESGDSCGSVGLSRLFSEGINGITGSKMNYSKIVNLICRGGWPGALGMSDHAAMSISHRYIKSVLKMDMQRVDGKRRSTTTIDLVLRSLARNNATSASIPTIAADIRTTGARISESTVHSYIDVLKKIFVIEEQQAWHPSLRSRMRLRTSPNRHFTDPSLAAAAMGASPDILDKDPKTAGFLFESLCFRDLSVYASAAGGRVFYYRDSNGLEADAIIELTDGRWGAVEMKMGVFEFDKAAKNLNSLKDKMVAAGSREPSFLMILNVTGGAAHMRPDGVVEVPIDCLGP